MKMENMNYLKFAGDAASEVSDELYSAKEKYPADFNSLHEGYGVLKEEVDELWDEIKAKHPDPDKVRSEAKQVAAMAIRIMIEFDRKYKESKAYNLNMTKAEAIKSMEAGNKITHRYFTDEEYMTIENGKIALEDGVKCPPAEFWEIRNGEGWADGYEIFREK